MAKKQGGGFLFNVFNIGFTVVMFALPSVLLGYWYVYIRDPGGQKRKPSSYNSNLRHLLALAVQRPRFLSDKTMNPDGPAVYLVKTLPV